MARGSKFCIYELEGLYYLCSENKGSDQLQGYREADLRLCFRICKKPVFSQRGSNINCIVSHQQNHQFDSLQKNNLFVRLRWELSQGGQTAGREVEHAKRTGIQMSNFAQQKSTIYHRYL